MEDRLVRLEEALEELRVENRELRQELNELRAQVSQTAPVPAPITEEAEATRWWRSRWGVAVLAAVIVIVPMVALTVGHVSAFWTTVIGTVNAFFIYLIGPGLVRLLAEGLIRAIPTVLLGQSARLYLDKRRFKKTQ